MDKVVSGVSILIRGMEMPVTCCHCKLMVYNTELVWDDAETERTGSWVCLLTGELIDNTKREEHCPLIPVPPHGRQGDLDALMEQFDGDCYGCPYDTCMARELVASAPTIIPAEEGE